MRSSRYTLEKPTTRGTSLKDAHSAASMSLGKLSSEMFQIWSNRPWTFKPLHWDKDVSVNAEEVQWAVPYLRLYASWLYPSALNLAQHLPPTSFQSPLVHQACQICRQSSHLRRPTSHLVCAIRGPIGRRILRKTYHPWNWTRLRIPWLHARNKATGTDLSGTNPSLTSSLTILSFSSNSPSQRLSFTMSYRHQRSFPVFTCSTRPLTVNSTVYPCWFSQWGTSDNFEPTPDSASELECWR